MDNGHFGKSRQNSLKRTHKQTLKKLEDNIRRLSCDVGKLYHDVSSFSIPCRESKPSRRKLFESMAAMTHHIGNLSTNEYYLNKNVRDLARNVCVEQKMVSFQTVLDRKDDDGECKKFPKAFTNPHSKERQKFLSKVDKFSKHYSKSPKFDSFLPGHVKNNRKSMNFFLNDTVGRNPMIMKPSRSLHCRTTKREFDKHKLRKEFDCESVDGSVFRSISVCSATADNIGPPFIRYNQFTADKVDQFTPKRVAPLTDRRHSSFNKFNQLTADKLDYDRCSLQSPSHKRPSSFRDFVRKSAVLDKCGNVVSESSCGSGVTKRRLKQRGEVGTSSCHPVSPTLFVKQQCSSSTEMINRHINSLNNRTVLMPLQQLEISYDRDVDFLYPLDNNLITAIMRTRSGQSLRSRTSCRKSISQQYPPNHPQCLPPVWPLECLTANSPPNPICPPKYPPLESRSWPWVGQMTRSCSNLNDTEIRCLCGCGQEDACLDPEVPNTPERLVEECAGRDCAEWSDYEWEWLIPPSLRGFSAYDILVGSIMMLALIPLTKYDVVSDRYLILLLFLVLTYRHY